MALTSQTFWRSSNAVLPLASALLATPAHDSWENEGGHLLGQGSEDASPLPAMKAFASDESECLAAEVQVMKRALLNDLASGRMGSRYNTYEHRARVLRQLSARLNAVKADLQCRSKGHE